MDAVGWAGLPQELLQGGSCPLPQNWSALVHGRAERWLPAATQVGLTPRDTKMAPDGWQCPVQRSNTLVMSCGMGEAASTMGSLEPCVPVALLLALTEGTHHDVCPQLHQHPGPPLKLPLPGLLPVWSLSSPSPVPICSGPSSSHISWCLCLGDTRTDAHHPCPSCPAP